MCCKGVIVRVQQCGGCIEVVVEGAAPGAFVVDNCLMPGLVDMLGKDWIGRQVEFEDGEMRFLDVEEREAGSDTSQLILSFHSPADPH